MAKEFEICEWNSTQTDVTDLQTNEHKTFTYKSEALNWIKEQDENAKISYYCYP
jgi:hypothetical protein